VISGLGNRSDPRPDQERLLCVVVDSLSRSATIKGVRRGTEINVHRVHSAPTTLATKTDQEDTKARGLVHLATNRRPMTPSRRPSPTPGRPPHRLKVYPRNL
jgi:hypothetical protein